MTPVSIYAEMTPNPNTMKFVANIMLLEGKGVEFSSSDDTSSSPLAAKLLNFPFIENVFVLGNFITITKNDKIEWDMVVMDVREFLTDFFKNEGKVLDDGIKAENVGRAVSAEVIDESSLNVASSDVEKKIIDTLEEFIRPAVESDGGAIDFRKFEDGTVTVILRGSCSGCPSASATLKNGVENLLTSMIPEVKEVVAEEL